MNMQLQLLLIWVLNALALLAVANFVPGIHVDGFGAALIAALFLGLVNTLHPPDTAVADAAGHGAHAGAVHLRHQRCMFWFVGSVLRGFVVDSFWSGVFGAVLYSIFSWALSSAAAQLIRKK